MDVRTLGKRSLDPKRHFRSQDIESEPLVSTALFVPRRRS
jgi:hypothetical protein